MRDLQWVLNRTPDDWDITTSATPYQVKELFYKTVDTGLQHGTVTVMVHGVGYEVTTYRIDGEYEDGRHPKEVQFTSNLDLRLKKIPKRQLWNWHRRFQRSVRSGSRQRQ